MVNSRRQTYLTVEFGKGYTHCSKLKGTRRSLYLVLAGSFRGSESVVLRKSNYGIGAEGFQNRPIVIAERYQTLMAAAAVPIP
jgi:hypothetical protein